MERGSPRILGDGERRRMASRLLTPAPGRPCSGGRQPEAPRSGRGGHERGRGGTPPQRPRRAPPARRFERLVLDLPARLGFPTAFCAAAAAWGAALLVALACVGLVGG